MTSRSVFTFLGLSLCLLWGACSPEAVGVGDAGPAPGIVDGSRQAEPDKGETANEAPSPERPPSTVSLDPSDGNAAGHRINRALDEREKMIEDVMVNREGVVSLDDRPVEPMEPLVENDPDFPEGPIPLDKGLPSTKSLIPVKRLDLRPH